MMWIDAVEVFPYRGQLTLYLGESGKSLVWMGRWGRALGKFMAEPQRHSSKQWGGRYFLYGADFVGNKAGSSRDTEPLPSGPRA